MFEISEMVKRIQGSERSQRRVTVPKGAIRMHMGEPDFPTPIHIQEAATRAMRENFTHYGNPYGDEELREAICLYLKRDYGVQRKPENVLVSAGGIEGIHVISATYLNPGDEVLILDPEYSAYADSVALFGGKPVFVPRTDRFHLDLKAIEGRISKSTRMVFLSNPSNPTASVLREEQIRGLTKIAMEHDLLLIIDEVYHKLIYGGIEHFSICQVDEVKDRAILLNSFSKTYAMTGWRVGYLVADAKIIKDLVGFHKALVTCVNTPSQKACVAAITGPQDCVESMKKEYDERRRLVENALKGIERISTRPCEGAFYFFPRFEHQITSRDMTSYLADNGILVRSGTEFGENGQKHIRISFTTSIEELEEGMDRLKRALDELD
ncbi:MAG: pyridoxal phosphate-dependent aminotransferase [Desulfobacteraceae bacterium]|nr:MAG: pyridoxal phosphate-dependent aminotransferase [Desulfobacteraceae bacterium]